VSVRRALDWRLEAGPRNGVRVASHVVHETWSEASPLVRVFELKRHLRGRLWEGLARYPDRPAALAAFEAAPAACR